MDAYIIAYSSKNNTFRILDKSPTAKVRVYDYDQDLVIEAINNKSITISNIHLIRNFEYFESLVKHKKYDRYDDIFDIDLKEQRFSKLVLGVIKDDVRKYYLHYCDINGNDNKILIDELIADEYDIKEYSNLTIVENTDKLRCNAITSYGKPVSLEIGAALNSRNLINYTDRYDKINRGALAKASMMWKDGLDNYLDMLCRDLKDSKEKDKDFNFKLNMYKDLFTSRYKDKIKLDKSLYNSGIDFVDILKTVNSVTSLDKKVIMKIIENSTDKAEIQNRFIVVANIIARNFKNSIGNYSISQKTLRGLIGNKYYRDVSFRVYDEDIIGIDPGVIINARVNIDTPNMKTFGGNTKIRLLLILINGMIYYHHFYFDDSTSSSNIKTKLFKSISNYLDHFGDLGVFSYYNTTNLLRKYDVQAEFKDLIIDCVKMGDIYSSILTALIEKQFISIDVHGTRNNKYLVSMVDGSALLIWGELKGAHPERSGYSIHNVVNIIKSYKDGEWPDLIGEQIDLFGTHGYKKSLYIKGILSGELL